MRPKIIKVAAKRGVGAMIVVEILFDIRILNKKKMLNLLHDERGIGNGRDG